MRRPFSRATIIKTGTIVAAWTAYGLMGASQSHYWYASTPTPMSWWDALRMEVLYGWLWALATPLVLFVSVRYRLERPNWLKNLPVHLALMTVLVPATKIAWEALALPPRSPFRHFTWLGLFRSVESNFDMGMLLYIVIVLVEHSIAYYNRYQNGLVKASQLQTQLVQAQLQALKMQLHPHFLFNTLHSITAMVHEDPEMAERTIMRLSELLRLFMASSSVQEVPLGEEIRVLELYLDIERARFEDRLQVGYDVPPSLRGATVPSLLLQPLVENSIRHGLARRAETGCISITAESIGDTLVVRVIDNGCGFRPDSQQRSGLGLAITRGRLESLYGPHQSLVLRNLPSTGVEARITVPLRMADNTEENYFTQSKDHVELQSTDR